MHDDTTKPEWLDLDGVASPGLRSDMAAITAEIEQLLPAVRDLSRRYHQAMTTAEDQMVDESVFADNSMASTLRALTGQIAMHSAMDRLVAHLWAATEESTPGYVPSWLDEVKA